MRKDLLSDGSRHVRVVGDDDERGRRSITLVRVAQRFADFSLLDVTLKTGRTHQIRVHLADAGHAIAGDPKYGDFALNRSLARGTLLPGLRFRAHFPGRARFLNHRRANGLPIELEAAAAARMHGPDRGFARGVPVARARHFPTALPGIVRPGADARRAPMQNGRFG